MTTGSNGGTYCDRVQARTWGSWAVDIGVALVLAAVGLLEIWLPLESVMGDGSPVISSIGVVWFAGHLLFRRARPWVALAGLLVWPILFIVQGGHLQILYFGQFVPLMVLTYSLARYAPGRLRWIGGLAVATLVLLADLTIPELATLNELIFHWASIGLAYALGFALRRATERAAAEAVRAHRAEVESREHALVAVADERARIARELHDIVAHSVGVIVVQAGSAEQVVEDNPEYARRALGAIRATGASALVEMRRLVTMLRDPDTGGELAPQPGVGTLPELVAAVEKSGLVVDLRVTGERAALPAGLDLTAYRIVQEALSNVRKHSRADRVDVTVDFGEEALAITVQDPGPPKPRDGTGPGHGLVGMRERAGLFGGHIETTAEEDGFTVRVVLPLEKV